MKKVVLAVILFFEIPTLFAQPDTLWTRTYDYGAGELCYAVEIMPDGGCVLGGIITDLWPEDEDLWIIRVDVDGDTLWTRRLGTEHDDQCFSIAVAPDCTILVAGTYDFQGGAFLVALSSSGDSLWSQTYSAQDCGWVGVVEDGFVLAGTKYQHFWLAKTDWNGDTLWTRSFPPIAEQCYAACRTTDGGFLLGGTDFDFEESIVVPLAIKVDSVGQLQWYRRFDEDWGEATCYAVVEAWDSGYLLGNELVLDGGQFGLSRLNADGTVAWRRSLGTPYGEYCRAACRSIDGGYVLVGLSSATPTHAPAGGMYKFDANLDSAWLFVLDREQRYHFSDVRQLPDGTYLVAGTTNYWEASGDIWLVKLTEELSVTEPVLITPLFYRLFINYPNPFNSSTRISFDLPREERVTARVFNVTGQEVALLADEVLNAGAHSLLFEADGLPSGIYFCNLQTATHSETRKMVLLK